MQNKSRKPLESMNYGKEHYNKIIENNWNNGWLQKYCKDINEYYELESITIKYVESVRELGGRNPKTIIAASIRIAGEDKGKKILLEDIRKNLGVTEVSIRNGIKHIKKNLGYKTIAVAPLLRTAS